MSDDKYEPPWDVKTVKISLGGVEDSGGWLEAKIFNDDEFIIQFKGSKVCFDANDPSGELVVEEMPLDVAKRLRDFLNYAVPKT